MPKWEYKMVREQYPREESLTEYGDAGWELMAATYGSDNGMFTFIFKRTKAEKPPTLPPIRK